MKISSTQTPIKENLTLSCATQDDTETLSELINSAYRGEQGWTREDMLLAGKRICVDDIKLLIENDLSHLLVARLNNQAVACICIELKENSAYIGSFAVSPAFQNMGLGKQVLSLAEDYAVNNLCTNHLMMVVISQRAELVAFYERRGYARTGKIEQFPIHLNVGIPLVEDLTIEYLEKTV